MQPSAANGREHYVDSCTNDPSSVADVVNTNVTDHKVLGFNFSSNKSTPTYTEILNNLVNFKLPDVNHALRILDDTKKLLMAEQNLLYIESPCTVVGDIHGQFVDLLLFATDDKKFVFLGDYVDRGTSSVEVILFLCLKKILHGNVYLLKGNHEMANQNETYGFKSECLLKYDISFYRKVNEVFEVMSIAAVVDRTYFLVHGGISPHIGNIADIMYLDRTDFGSFLPLLWSDPQEENGYKTSPRGAGYLFGPDVLNKFLDDNQLSYVVRSHQLVMEGYKIMGRCIFVWSAPNYCNAMGNAASIMNINGQGFDFFTFTAASKNKSTTFGQDGAQM
ncbi:Serine/threonine specific protein phosphatase [Trachipleistophora hominis]|uniref:protein-serine/threonine phosphatase n=1 Tax=Trachipleistophora hominis TaxID=72359 RepID=L7JS87_TRAHO|nr:Serine/threonine specific protein phosphatase [Trachipleistophora hominis]